MLIIVDVIVMNLDLIRIRDPSARAITVWRLIRTFVENSNSLTTPPGDFHVENLDIKASVNSDSGFFGRLIAKVRTKQAETRDARPVTHRAINEATDFEKRRRAFAMLTI